MVDTTMFYTYENIKEPEELILAAQVRAENIYALAVITDGHVVDGEGEIKRLYFNGADGILQIAELGDYIISGWGTSYIQADKEIFEAKYKR